MSFIGTLKRKVLKPVVVGVVPKRLIAWKAYPSQELLALTFDDGPNSDFTPKFLDLLRQYRAKATFFLVGRSVEQQPELARQIVIEGHEVGNHSMTHNHFTKTKLQNVKKEIDKAQDVIHETSGERPALFRPPYGILSLGVVGHCIRRGITAAMWSLDSLDCERKSTDFVRRVVQAHEFRRGDIILMHDDNYHSLQILPEFIQTQQALGRRFVTMSELLRS